MATHSSVLAWRIPGTEEPGGLPSVGSHRVGHDLAAAEADSLAQKSSININVSEGLTESRTDCLTKKSPLKTGSL